MSNNKQSSIDYYAFEALRLHVLLENRTISVGEYAVKHHELSEQAKAMHKEEIIEFAINFTYGTKRVGESIKKDFIKLYNETYKDNEQQ
jgi:hypothetical protein